MLHLKDKLHLCHILHAKLKVTLNRCEKPQTKLPRPIVGGQFSEDGTGVRLTFKEKNKKVQRMRTTWHSD